MEEKNILYACLICCTIGILVILFIGEVKQPKIYAARDINASMEGSKIMVQGYLERMEGYEKVSRFTIRDTTGSITTVIFENDISLKENSFLQITGEVSVFNNRTELLAKAIYSS